MKQLVSGCGSLMCIAGVLGLVSVFTGLRGEGFDLGVFLLCSFLFMAGLLMSQYKGGEDSRSGSTRVGAAPSGQGRVSIKSAANALIAAGSIYLIIGGLGILLSIEQYPPIDTFGRVALGTIVSLGLILWCAAVLLYRSSWGGVYMWYLVSPLVLLQFPIGTILTYFVYRDLGKDGAKDSLKRGGWLSAPLGLVLPVGLAILVVRGIGPDGYLTAWVKRAQRPKADPSASSEETRKQLPQPNRFVGTEEAQKEALQLYPDLKDKGSTFRKAFEAKFHEYERTNPAYFDDKTWPVKLARETKASLPDSAE